MRCRKLAAVLAAVFVAAGAHCIAASDDTTILRVFLKNGTALASYGEPALVGSRVVFSMPTAAGDNPPLQLVTLPLDRVDWERTEHYAAAARAKHYIATRADADYAALSNGVARALDEVTRSNDAGYRLAVAQRVRKELADWPATHYNYREAEVRQLLGMLDEAIADLNAKGGQHLDLNLSAFADPPVLTEPLLPNLTPQEAIAQVLTASRVVETATDREALLEAALASLDRETASLPADWAATVRADTQKALTAERRVDHAYQALTQRVMLVANRRARAADVRHLQGLVARVHAEDRTLGAKRPAMVDALLAAVQDRLDAARRLQLARDHWALRVHAYRRYGTAVRWPLERFRRLTPSLEAIKALAGSSPAALASMERVTAQTLKQVSAIAPPEELRSAHALLVSAVQLAASAARIRAEAARAGSMTRAWDASSAAAGALILGARARTEIQTLLRPPRLQ